VPHAYKEDPSLGIWVDSQRTVFKTGKMDLERKMRLDEICFDFAPKENTNEENWNLQFKRLRDYYGKHGHCELLGAVGCFTFILHIPTNTTPASPCITGQVPQEYEEDQKLANWVKRQRKHLKNGKLDQEQKRRLEEIYFVFISHEEKWNIQFDSLHQFKNDNGHCEWL
jgi:hypothetical protein